MAADMVSGVHRCEHITSVLEDLHWLPVSQRVLFKTALMDRKCVHGVAPAYLSEQRTLDEDCRQAEEPKQLVDEASQFHLGRQCQHSAVICSGALLFSSRVLRPSLVMLSSHKSGQCAVELYHAFHLWYPLFYTSPASSALQH